MRMKFSLGDPGAAIRHGDISSSVGMKKTGLAVDSGSFQRQCRFVKTGFKPLFP